MTTELSWGSDEAFAGTSRCRGTRQGVALSNALRMVLTVSKADLLKKGATEAGQRKEPGRKETRFLTLGNLSRRLQP